MLTPNSRFALALLFASTFLCAVPSHAQNSQQQQPPAQPAANTQAPASDAKPPADAKPATDAKPAVDAKPATADVKPAPKPEKKVWTNEDMGSLNGPTYAPNSRPAARQNSYHPGSDAGGGNATYYRNQMATLRSKIADIDAKIDGYQAVAHGEAPGEGQKLYGERVADSNYNLQTLVRQKETLQKQISDLEDQARHAGIEPGQLR